MARGKRANNDNCFAKLFKVLNSFFWTGAWIHWTSRFESTLLQKFTSRAELFRGVWNCIRHYDYLKTKRSSSVLKSEHFQTLDNTFCSDVECRKYYDFWHYFGFWLARTLTCTVNVGTEQVVNKLFSLGVIAELARMWFPTSVVTYIYLTISFSKRFK